MTLDRDRADRDRRLDIGLRFQTLEHLGAAFPTTVIARFGLSTLRVLPAVAPMATAVLLGLWDATHFSTIRDIRTLDIVSGG